MAHHILVAHEQLKGRSYSTPSLATPHDIISQFSHYGVTIAMINSDRTDNTSYVGNPHTYTGYS